MLATSLSFCSKAVIQEALFARKLFMASSVSQDVLFAGPGSEQLRGQSCKSLGKCNKQTPKLSKDDLQNKLQALPAWQLDEANTTLTRTFTAKKFVAAVKFFDQVAEVAEEEGHHPDLHLTDYREVKVVLSTHAIGGLSMFDAILAAKIDALSVDYSPKWLQQQAQTSS